jgi:glycosyltransferase 2 family protein
MRERIRAMNQRLLLLRGMGLNRFVLITTAFSMLWVVETLETFLLLLGCGFPVNIVQAAIIESVVSLARVLVFFLPAGAGVQEAGYATIMHALGVSSNVGDVTGFLVLKRVRDLIWIGGGYAILASLGIRSTRDFLAARTA